jgi:hypothetical protein
MQLELSLGSQGTARSDSNLKVPLPHTVFFPTHFISRLLQAIAADSV